jgi:hypothetical protein
LSVTPRSVFRDVSPGLDETVADAQP